MGGVGGGLGLGELSSNSFSKSLCTSDADNIQRLNELDDQDEPIIEVGPDVVVSDFSDDTSDDNIDDWSRG